MPLGELAGSYLEAIATMEDDQLPHISAFITVASQLILIKSRALLPREPQPAASADEGTDPEEALRLRLIEYKRYRDAAASLAALAGVRTRRCSIASPRIALGVGAVPAPWRRRPARWTRAALPRALGALGPGGPAARRSRRRSMPRTVTLAGPRRVIREALRSAPALVLQDLLAGVTDRVVVAVTFLAMLELVKGRELIVEQIGAVGAHRPSRRARRPSAAPAWRPSTGRATEPTH